ncbi:hemicentin-1-like [Maniola jurtina]|uniref:hemicentin-1-like n=1 Tax=Maniola jurtina TaxID=191418 RepID=UPI001E68ED61|nr:hemicentin-1-like [Maniola jurtina]
MGANYFVFSFIFFLCKGLGVIRPEPSTKSLNEGKGSLVFVFDTTGSMFNDLRQLREGAEMILNTALEESHVIADFVFVPFHDPGVGPATVTTDKEVFQRALAGVGRVYGGGNCPEMTLHGVRLALAVSRPRSFLYVFTDASAYDHGLLADVLDAVQRKQSQVVFVLTGHCNDVDKPTFRVYHQIATASSGQVFNLNKTSVHQVLDFVRSSIRGRTVNLASAVNPPGYNYTQQIPVDKSVGEVTVSVSGAKPQIRVLSPSGEELEGPPRLLTTLDLSQIMIVKVLNPEPGNWSVTVGSEEQHSVRVLGRSELRFQHGFSVQPPQAMPETSYRPLKGTYNHMLISLNGFDAPIHMEQAQLLSMDGKPLFEVPLKVLDKQRQTYRADAFIPPDDFFNIAIIGRDENGQEIRRIGPTAVQAKPPDAPYLVVSDKIAARAHSRVVLWCHVDSLVPVSAAWARAGAPLQARTQAVQSTSIEYVIEEMEEGSVGAYQCVASNAAGATEATTELDMIVDPPRVAVSPKNATLTEDDTLTLTCTVFSEALLKRTQILFNGTVNNNYTTNIDLEPSIDGYYTYSQTIQNASLRDAGVYTCVASNRGGTTNRSSYIQVQLKPTAQIVGEHTITEHIHADVQLTCNVHNAATVQWLDVNYNIVKEYEVNGSYSAVVDINNVTEDGVWTCVAVKDALTADDSVNLTVVIKPRVTIEGSRNITIVNGTTQEITCTVVGKPAPVVVNWRSESGRSLPSTLTNPEANMYKSVITLDSTKGSVNGTYSCTGLNSEGEEKDNITVRVRTKMTLLQGFSDTSVELYSQTDFHCLFDADPVPNITWYHNGTALNTDNINISDDNTIINIQKIDFDDLGLYVCEADNGYEKMTVNGTLSVYELEGPVISKEIGKISTLEGKSTIMTCRVLKGNPEPNIQWEFKPKISNNFTTLPQNVEINEQNGIRINKISKQNAGVYKCIAENIIGSDLYEVELIVQYPPEFNVSRETHSELEGPKEVQVGETVKLQCNVSAVPPPIVTWTKDGSPVVCCTRVYLGENYSLVIANVTKFESGIYACNASSALGFILKNFTINVYKAPEIVKRGKPETAVVQGQLVELACGARGEPAPAQRWLHDGQPVLEPRKYVDEYGLRFAANLSDSGVYTCLATNHYGNASVNYTVFVWASPYLEPPLEVLEEVESGANLSIECNAVGFPEPTITWKFRGHILNHNTTDLSLNEYGHLRITNASAQNEGPYHCVAENTAGSANKTYYVSVKESPRIFEDNHTGPYVVASNLDTALVIPCKAAGNPKPHIAWIKDGFYLNTDSRYGVGSDGALTIKELTEDQSGVYTCVAANSAGNATRDMPVRVYAAPELMQDAATRSDVTAVEGASVTLQCPVRAGDYSVTWYKDTTLISNGSLHFSNVSRANASTYTCVATNAAGAARSAVALRVQWPPRALAPEDETVEAVKGGAHYLDCRTDANPRAKTKWLFNSRLLLGEDKDLLKLSNLSLRHGGVYRCVAGNQHGSIYKQFNFTVLEPPFISELELLEVRLKAGAGATLECAARGTPTPTISWTFNNTNWVVQGSGAVCANVSSAAAGDLRCSADSRAGVARLTYRVALAAEPSVERIEVDRDGVRSDVNDTLDVVLNTTVRLSCTASGSPQPTVQWVRHGNTVGADAELVLHDISVGHAGLYACVAANEAGLHEKSVRVNVLEPPRIFQTVFHNANTSQHTSELVVLSGRAFRLPCHARGNPPPEVYWFKDNLPLALNDDAMVSAELGQVLVAHSARGGHAGNYTCLARNSVGEDSAVYLVDVLVPPPTPKHNMTYTRSVRGAALELTCAARGHPPPSVTWLKHPYTEVRDGTRVRLLDDNCTLMIPEPEVSDSGRYSCIMSNKVGTAELVYDVSIETPPTIAGDATQRRVLLLRRSAVLACEADGRPAPNITWFKDTQQLNDSLPNIQRVSGSSLMGLWSVNVGDAGQYICVAENSVGTAQRRYDVAVQVPGEWSAWSSWSFCNVTCGAGAQHRTRLCRYTDDYNNTIDKHSRPDKVIVDESACSGRSEASRTCNMPPCEEEEVSSAWSSWSLWSRCSVTCGAGSQARSRRCRGRTPCGGDNVQIRKCPGLPACAASGHRSAGMPDHRSGETDPEYIPEATIEMQSPETIMAKTYSSEMDEDFYIPSEVMHSVYKVVVSDNLDGSARGPCGPGFTHHADDDSCADIDECLLDSNQCHLTQVCGNAPGGYTCSCPAGYASLGAGQRCLDMNECALDTHGCEFACVNAAGGFVCACPAPLRLRADRRTCAAPSMYRAPNSYEDLDMEDDVGTSSEYSPE